MTLRQRIEARAARQTDPRKAEVLRELAKEAETIRFAPSPEAW